MHPLNHTPGPWVISKDERFGLEYCIGTEAGYIDEIALCDERNAKIIRAAPAMLKALIAISDAKQQIHEQDPTDFYALQSIARTAIEELYRE